MSKIKLSENNYTIKEIEEARNNVEQKSEMFEKLLLGIVKVYTADLDSLMEKLMAEIQSEIPLDDITLDKYSLRLSSLMYFAGEGQELIGLREGIAKMIRKEKFNDNYRSAIGTINDKNASAELSTQEETLAELVYDKAEAIMANKLEKAEQMLSAIKRIISRRIEEMKINAPVKIICNDQPVNIPVHEKITF